MLNKKEVADTLAKSLITGESIASIMLKAQMLASLLENEEFSNLVRYEQNGYPEGVIVPIYKESLSWAKRKVPPYYFLFTSYGLNTEFERRGVNTEGCQWRLKRVGAELCSK